MFIRPVMQPAESEREAQLRALFTKLHEGFKWMERHPDEVEANEGLIERSEVILQECVKLGCDYNYAQALFFWGDHRLVKMSPKPLSDPPAVVNQTLFE